MRAEFDGSFDGWRVTARRLLAAKVSPEQAAWEVTGAPETQACFQDLDYPPRARHTPPDDPKVSRRFLLLARLVACHRDPGRWAALYRALWRHAAGEPHLLSLVTDPDVYPLLLMARSVRRSAHKMKAFVRFRTLRSGDEEPAYVAWFEPTHLVLEATAPFFVRRFPSMRWSILTPDRCAHWDRRSLRFTPGATRQAAPSDDELEQLWRTYYAHIFNPARLNQRAMRAEMPKRYWANLPEAALVDGLAREAPRRVAEMLARPHAPPEPLPEDCRATAPLPGLLAAGWHPVHDPGLDPARARAERAAAVAATAGIVTPGGQRILIGVAGWTDPTLTRGNVFYPSGVETPEARLRHYAARFPLVEVDATYYALPTRAMAVEWAARTPEHFVFDVKAHGLMTGHGTDVRRLPDWLRRSVPRAGLRANRIYGKDLPAELRDEIWRRFLDALEPLRAAGKLGAILFQFPRWFTPSRESARFLADVRERVGDVSGAVEFRHRAWVAGRVAGRTLGLLEELGLCYVVVDGPQGMESSIPPLLAVTSPRLAVLRLHGRRRETWERRNDPATERYRYLYDDDELAEHLRAVLDLSERQARALHIVYNNCHGNYAVTNAAELSHRLLVSPGPGPSPGGATVAPPG